MSFILFILTRTTTYLDLLQYEKSLGSIPKANI